MGSEQDLFGERGAIRDDVDKLSDEGRAWANLAPDDRREQDSRLVRALHRLGERLRRLGGVLEGREGSAEGVPESPLGPATRVAAAEIEREASAVAAGTATAESLQCALDVVSRSVPGRLDRHLPAFQVSANKGVVLLDVKGDPASPAVDRLVKEAAAAAFRALDAVDEIEVRRPDGILLAHRQRSQQPKGPPPAPADVPRLDSKGPPLSLREPDPYEASRKLAADARPSRSLLDRLDVSQTIRASVDDENDLTSIVEGILRHAGLQPMRDDDVLKVGDYALVIIKAPFGATVDVPQLNHAYFRFTGSGASRGFTLTAGFLDRHEVSRREALDPRLRHLGFDAVQRMADAVVAGADPLMFALPPSVRDRSTLGA